VGRILKNSKGGCEMRTHFIQYWRSFKCYVGSAARARTERRALPDMTTVVLFRSGSIAVFIVVMIAAR
jgi:hypothetical protein